MTGSEAAPATLLDWLRYAESRFRKARLGFGHGTQNARDEAAWLLAHALKIPHERLERSRARELTAAERRRTLRLIEQRVKTRKPLAYLIREAWIGDLRFFVDERVIVPRSFIAELLREKLKPWIARPANVSRVLDLCTGSGCLAVMAALKFPRARVDATDISRPALQVARRNIRDYRLGRRVKPVHGDLYTGLPPRRYNLILANPPYVKARAMRALPREYSREPRIALAGGTDGLLLVRRILRDASRFLRPGGLLVVEIGHNRQALERAYPRTPFHWLETSAGDGFVFLLVREDLPQ
jgi:ribosomal protein L3 glutamine methyltransferase